MRITPIEAQRALVMLVAERKLTEKQVLDAARRADIWMADARRRLAQLEGRTEKDGPFPMNRRTRRKPISSARRKQMAEQGRYLAAVRRLSKADRAKVREIRSERGMTAAMAAARKLA